MSPDCGSGDRDHHRKKAEDGAGKDKEDGET